MLGESVCTSRNLIGTDKLGLLCIAEGTYRSVGGNRQANTDKHLNLIQTISQCLHQEARSDRSKRPGGRISGSGGCIPCLFHSFSFCQTPALTLPSSVFASQFSCKWPQENPDPQPQAMLPLSYCFTPPSHSLTVSALPISEDLYVSLCALQEKYAEMVEKAAWDEFPAVV